MIYENYRVFLGSLLIAIIIHVFGIFMFQVRDELLPSWKITQVLFIDDLFVMKSSPPEISTDKLNSIPSFVSLPETSFILNQKSSIQFNRIKYYKEQEEEALFKEAQKLIAREAYYFKNELDASMFLPLKETKPDLRSLLVNTSKQMNIKRSTGFRVFYKGMNKIQIEKQHDDLFKFISELSFKPKKVLTLFLSYTEKNELINCHIDESSGIVEFDNEVLRYLKAKILPIQTPKVKFRGQLIIKWIE